MAIGMKLIQLVAVSAMVTPVLGSSERRAGDREVAS